MTAISARARSGETGGSTGHTRPSNRAPHRLISEVRFGEAVIVRSFTNLYGCSIGSRTRIGSFVEIQSGASIRSYCKIEGHTFICDGVTIGDRVFVGHGVIFINDRHPRATREDGTLQGEGDWEMKRTIVEPGASLGSGAVVLGDVRIGEGALVEAKARWSPETFSRVTPSRGTRHGRSRRRRCAGVQPPSDRRSKMHSGSAASASPSAGSWRSGRASSPHASTGST